MSRMARSKVSPSATQRSASSGDSVSRGTMPHLAVCRPSTRRLVALSSTTSTRRPSSLGCVPMISRRPCAGSAATGALIVNENVAPRPGPPLSAHIVPPISSASRLLMASPSPVPPYLRVVEASAWLNFWKRLADALGGKADARVAHGEGQLGRVAVTAAVTRQHDFAALGELDGVGEQVEQDLPQPRHVAAHGRRHVALEHVGEIELLLRPRACRRGRAPTRRTRAGRTDAPRCPCARPRSSRSRGCR